ncbi:MAG: hypothetical protein P8Y95_09785 [Gammaproteobacteria bacterium]|jgi:hypothetical protein
MSRDFNVCLYLPRPLSELATVFDMSGLAVRVVESGALHRLESREPGLELNMAPAAGPEYTFDGVISAPLPKGETVLEHVALALDADGVKFEITLLNHNGEVVRRYAASS